MRRKKPKRLLSAVLIFAILAVGAYVFATAINGDGGPILVESASSRPRTEDASSAASASFPHFTREVHISEIADTQYLKLVNRDRAVANPVSHTHLTTVWPDMPARTSYVKLHETAFLAMRELFAAAQNANIGSLFIASGYRSQEEQSNLYTNAVDKAYVMPPGHSEHQLGLAADILSGDDTSGMRGSEEARWLAANAPAFGLILRYPEDKQEITGVAYEPWHFRYVGRIHAHYMEQHNFVLEEYIEYLRTQGGFQREFAGRSYYVLYQRPENGIILVPEQLDFRVSSTNTGGYVVTAWR